MYVYEDERECPYCSEKDAEKQDAVEFLREILDQAYNRKEFHEGLFENALDELCRYFGVDLYTDEISIKAKNHPLSPYFASAIETLRHHKQELV